MKTLNDFHNISLFTDDDPLGNTKRDGSSNGVPNEAAFSTTSLYKVVKRTVCKPFLVAYEYLVADFCRAVFILCLSAVTLASLIYYTGLSSKQRLQEYLVELENQLYHERSINSLVRNIDGLTDSFAGAEKGDYAVNTEQELTEYTNNIKNYFARRAPDTITTFFINKVRDFETKIYDTARTMMVPTSLTQSGIQNHTQSFKDSLHYLTLIKDFAVDEQAKVQKKIDRLKDDSRSYMVGTVNLYNTMMDLSSVAGICFLILAVASLPSLGKEFKTGFV